MSYWTDDRALGHEQRRLDAAQQRATSKKEGDMAGFDIEKFRRIGGRARALEDAIMAECSKSGAAISREQAGNIAAVVRRHHAEQEAEEDRQSRGAHLEPGGVERPEGYYHGPLEPAEAPPFCDRCMGYHADGACPDDEDEDD